MKRTIHYPESDIVLEYYTDEIVQNQDKDTQEELRFRYFEVASLDTGDVMLRVKTQDKDTELYSYLSPDEADFLADSLHRYAEISRMKNAQ